MKIDLEFNNYQEMLDYCNDVTSGKIKQASNKKMPINHYKKSCNESVTVANNQIKLGDCVAVNEKEGREQLYQYVVAPDGKRGLIRANCLTDGNGEERWEVFDKNGSNVYAKSTLKKFVDDWAAKQDFDAFVAEVSLLELPRADTSNEAWEENCNYVLSLRLSEDLNWIWTKTASSSFASDVWYVNAYDSAYPVRTCHALGSNGVSPALWLKSDVQLSVVSGSGTKEEPYKVEIEGNK